MLELLRLSYILALLLIINARNMPEEKIDLIDYTIRNYINYQE